MTFVEIRNVSKSFSSSRSVRHVLKEVNLIVEEGEFVSVVGFTGSGKTTLLNIAAGLSQPDTGYVKIKERRSTAFIMTQQSYFKIIHCCLGFLRWKMCGWR